MTELHLGPGWRKLGKDEVAPGGQEQIHHYWLDQPFHSAVKSEVWVFDNETPDDSLVPHKEVDLIMDLPLQQMIVVTVGDEGVGKIVTTYKRTRSFEEEPWNAWELVL